MTTLLISYLLLLLAMFLIQGKLLFHPSAKIANPSEYQLADFEVVNIKTEDQQNLIGWFHKGSSEKAVIYFYGNADTLANYPDFFRKLAEDGYTVLGINYRGYGGSTGKPNERGLYEDGKAAIMFMEKHVKQQNIIYVGRSLGSGVATEMATTHKLKGLVLISPYTSISNVAAELYWYLPVKYLSRFKFASIDKIAKLREPLLIIHGEKDTLIPLAHAEKLLQTATSRKELKVYKNIGHNDIDMVRVANDMNEFFGTGNDNNRILNR